ncbi:histidine kinase dimerization/phosphoacceptor domain -containing protein [Fredinandcohnia sp. QZ13]|uniref:histidine kinase dimerization/phosphoacceptor domain -containing protein n=1 Tax=Fredinandcohnia sp. QZ13 TaxID=3073144 RepID=UPI0028533C93|nr:histidine kinase dimerization/phosphoacceptor domain -containing protein [Fredinandcohnia sp. QZ13]MDR4890065.1 histidine kinase dimerization/phosphoacceptor domain -containing protein [Fredinandcohnia sp. QZ13]
MSEFILECTNITYISPDGDIDHLNFHLKDSEIHAFIIKNSSEQKVFIQALRKLLEKPGLHGEIKLKDKVLTNYKHTKHKIAIIQQEPSLINNFSIAENLSLSSIPTRKFLPFVDWKQVTKRAEQVLHLLDFQFDYKKKVKSLSDEEKRIVYIARSFIQKPEIIVIQEPMEGLSDINASKLYNALKQFKIDGGSIIYITKQWEDALKLANRISILSNGRITAEMTAEEAIADPQKLLKKIENYHFNYHDEYKDDETKPVLDAVFKAAEFLTSEYELKDVLLLLAKEVTRVMNADSSSIKLLDEATWSIIDDFEYKNNQTVTAQLTKEAIVKIAKGNEIYYANKNDSVFPSLFEKIDNVKTIICIPVLIRSQVTGIIQVSYENLYVYSKEETKFLSALARHAAIAIEDTRLMGRSALLQESHHRIKNNLQSIVGLISAQKMFVKNNPEQSVGELLDSIIFRIKSIASVHNLLSKEKLGRSIINVKQIIEAIISIINTNPNIRIQFELEDIFIPYNKATSIALIINELVINCFKHAFSDDDSGIIVITCKKIDNTIYLSVRDNGRGVPENFDMSKLASLGLSIIQGIVSSDFQGQMTFESTKGNTLVEIKLPTERIFLHQ